MFFTRFYAAGVSPAPVIVPGEGTRDACSREQFLDLLPGEEEVAINRGATNVQSFRDLLGGHAILVVHQEHFPLPLRHPVGRDLHEHGRLPGNQVLVGRNPGALVERVPRSLQESLVYFLMFHEIDHRVSRDRVEVSQDGFTGIDMFSLFPQLHEQFLRYFPGVFPGTRQAFQETVHGTRVMKVDFLVGLVVSFF